MNSERSTIRPGSPDPVVARERRERTNPPRSGWHWLAAALGVLLLPKCLLCVAGYIAGAAGLAGGTLELCGALETGRSALPVMSLAAGTFTVAVVTWRLRMNRRNVSGTGHIAR